MDKTDTMWRLQSLFTCSLKLSCQKLICLIVHIYHTHLHSFNGTIHVQGSQLYSLKINTFKFTINSSLKYFTKPTLQFCHPSSSLLQSFKQLGKKNPFYLPVPLFFHSGSLELRYLLGLCPVTWFWLSNGTRLCITTLLLFSYVPFHNLVREGL